MAYQADILINVKGFQDLGRIQKALEGTAQKIDAVNKAAATMGAPNRTIERFAKQLALAEKSLQKVAIGSVQEQRAISNYVTALNNSNVARDRQNKLIQTEINTRNAATNAIRASVEANIAESKATRLAREEAKALNTELVNQERLKRKLSERGLTQLPSGEVVKAVTPTTPLPKARGPVSPIGGRADLPGSPAALKAASEAQSKLFENLALGAGFPLLFGGGPGQVLGGLAGSFVGTGFGGQILGSAIGGQLEALGVAASQAGAALQKPIDNFNIIEQRALLASSSQEKYVKNLIDAGQYIEATAAVQKRYNEVVGTEGSKNLLNLAAQSDKLNRAWSELSLQIQAALAGPLAGLLNWVANLIQRGNDIRGAGASGSQLTPQQRQEIQGRREALQRGRQRGTLFGGLTPQQAIKEEQAIANRVKQFRAQNQPSAQTGPGFQATEVAQTASLERRREIQAQITKLREAELSSAQKQIQLDTTILTKQLEFATSLNQQSALIDKIAAKKVESANAEYQLVQRQQQTAITNAKLALESAQAKATAAQKEMENLAAAGKLTETKKAELQATIDKVFVAEKELATTQQIAGVVTQRAQQERQVAATIADVERRQQQVAAFATEAAAQTERFNQAANESLNALNNNLKVVDAYSQAQLTINNLEIQSLQNKLAQATTDGERYDILDSIRDLEIENAGITLQATRAQIAAEVERQRIALSMAEVKYKELEAVVRLAAAQKVLTQDHIRALDAQRSALVIAQQNYATSQAVANEQYRAADAVYNAAVNAANLKMNLEGSAAAAGAIAGSMERAANATASAAGGYLTASNIKNPLLRAEAEGRIAEIDRRTPRTGNILGALKALDDKQQIVLNYMALEKKAAQEQQRQSAAQELRSLGLSRYIPLEYRTQEDKPALFQRYGSSASSSGGSVNPQVSITTGPVMRMGDQNYVSQSDLMSATSTAAKQGAALALSKLKDDPATRRSVGILR